MSIRRSAAAIQVNKFLYLTIECRGYPNVNYDNNSHDYLSGLRAEI